MLTSQSFINGITAIAVYYLVLKHQGTVQSHLFGYGIICPILATVPLKISQALGMHSMVLIVAQAGSMTVVFFRCMMGK